MKEIEPGGGMHPWHPCWIYVCCWIRDQQNLFTGCNEVVAKVMFLLICVILCTGGGGGVVLSQHALQVVSQHALQQVLGGGLGIPACLAGFQVHTQGGS